MGCTSCLTGCCVAATVVDLILRGCCRYRRTGSLATCAPACSCRMTGRGGSPPPLSLSPPLRLGCQQQQQRRAHQQHQDGEHLDLGGDLLLEGAGQVERLGHDYPRYEAADHEVVEGEGEARQRGAPSSWAASWIQRRSSPGGPVSGPINRPRRRSEQVLWA